MWTTRRGGEVAWSYTCTFANPISSRLLWGNHVAHPESQWVFDRARKLTYVEVFSPQICWFTPRENRSWRASATALGNKRTSEWSNVSLPRYRCAFHRGECPRELRELAIPLSVISVSTVAGSDALLRSVFSKWLKRRGKEEWRVFLKYYAKKKSADDRHLR